MNLLNSDVKQFKKLYKRHFNEEIADDEARRQLTLLVRQMEIVYQPITAAQFDKALIKYVDVNEGKGNERADNS